MFPYTDCYSKEYRKWRMDCSILFASDADTTWILASAFACNITFFLFVLMHYLIHDISGGLEVNSPLKLL